MPTLRELREQHAWSMRDLCAASGVAQTTIVALEHGRRPPRPSTRRRLAAALGVDPAQIDWAPRPESPE